MTDAERQTRRRARYRCEYTASSLNPLPGFGPCRPHRRQAARRERLALEPRPELCPLHTCQAFSLSKVAPSLCILPRSLRRRRKDLFASSSILPSSPFTSIIFSTTIISISFMPIFLPTHSSPFPPPIFSSFSILSPFLYPLSHLLFTQRVAPIVRALLIYSFLFLCFLSFFFFFTLVSASRTARGLAVLFPFFFLFLFFFLSFFFFFVLLLIFFLYLFFFFLSSFLL